MFTFSSLAHRLNSRSATAKAKRADKVKMINLVEIELVISILFYSIKCDIKGVSKEVTFGTDQNPPSPSR